MPDPDPRAPVLVGVGVVTQREEDPGRASESVELMIAAAKAAGIDSGRPALLAQIERIYVPQGRWRYADPGRLVASAVGAPSATTVLARVGILQQTLLGDACRRIAEGEIDTAVVVGGEAGYRLLRGRITGKPLHDTASSEGPDVELRPHAEMGHPVEMAAGLSSAAASYAIIETAFGAARNWTLSHHRDVLGRLYSGLSDVAAGNPDAWTRRHVDVEDIREPSPKNPMIAFPYTKRLVSSWNVDQAAALLFCSASRAIELGIHPSKWVHPWASTESNHMLPLSARTELGGCLGAEIAGQAALELAELESADLDLLELYSCFPVAIGTYAAALGIDPLERPVSVSGGMPFAGGPLNNYVFQATCRMAQLLRSEPGRTGLVSCVSGLLTKQGFGIWSTDPGPNGFAFADVTDAVAADARFTTKAVVGDHAGPGRVAGYTVLHDAEGPTRGIAVIDVSETARTVAYCEVPAVLAALESAQYCGRVVEVHDGQFRLSV